MSTQTALKQSKVLTFVVIGIFLWLLLTLVRVASAFDLTAVSASDFIGRNALGGVVGVVVMLILLGVLVALLGELMETDPLPDTWPPSE
jgi:ABC-type siderophore export system fused ATPase/permease subunit